jgi:hypothetical protein
MKLPDEHGGAMVNGSVRLELRGVATGVSAVAWQRVNMRVHHLDRESRARLPQVRVCVSRTPVEKESDPAWRWLTETTHYAAGTPSCEQNITVKNGACLATMRRSAARF